MGSVKNVSAPEVLLQQYQNALVRDNRGRADDVEN